MSSNRMVRRVLVQFMSSHRHVEMVEVSGLVRRRDDACWEGELRSIEKAARDRLSRRDARYGPWGDAVDQFEVMSVLVAEIGGPNPGRIHPLKQVELEVTEDWV